MSIDVIKTVQNVIMALSTVEVKGPTNMEAVLGSINALRQVAAELSKPAETEAKPEIIGDPEVDDGK